jgi:arylsulfatase
VNELQRCRDSKFHRPAALAKATGTKRATVIMRATASLLAMWLGLFLVAGAADSRRLVAAPPNVVVLFADDLGYGDVGCFGAKDIRTPHLDRMAKEGMRFTDFYVSQPVCTASRASLMTGCYAQRVGLAGALNHSSTQGIADRELLLPEICRARGYTTAAYGKWHLGHRAEFNPTRHGFDHFAGIPYSNDNSRYHPVVKDIPPLPWIEDTRVVEEDPDQSRFTRRCTDLAVSFIEKNKDRPFFLYVPHVMPHVPIFASETFRGRSARGLYGDVVEELDAGVGEILAAIERCKLAEKTLVLFFSDNGPFLSYGEHAGSAGELREGKLTTFEGGVRVPMIAKWPGVVPAGRVCREVAASIDLLPTIRQLVDGAIPERRLDGRDIGPLLRGDPQARSPHEALLFYEGQTLQAIRMGKWKLHLPHPYLTVAGPPGRNGKPSNFENLKPESIQQSGIRGIASRHGYAVRELELSLFDLEADPGERRNLASQHPEIILKMRETAAAMEAANANADAKLAAAAAPVAPAAPAAAAAAATGISAAAAAKDSTAAGKGQR